MNPHTDGNQVPERLNTYKYMQLPSSRAEVQTQVLLMPQTVFLSTNLQGCCAVVAIVTALIRKPLATYIAEYQSNMGLQQRGDMGSGK